MGESDGRERGSASGMAKENGPSQRDRLSYRDKLLSLGESGYLSFSMSNAEALHGWKEYFASFNEKQTVEGGEDDEKMDESDEDVVDTWRRTGKLPSLRTNADEYTDWCKPYMNSLIVKLMGKTFSFGFMRQRMERMWGSKNPMRVTPLSNGYFIVSFSTKEDRDFALQEGPWMIADHYLLVQRWRPNFNPLKADSHKRIAVWVRIPNLPVELYNVESLRRIGDFMGKTLKIDRTTAFSERGGFARICVEIDLLKPLLPGFSHFGEEYRFEYEGLHLVCFTCGQYGHRMGQCTVKSGGGNNDEGETLNKPPVTQPEMSAEGATVPESEKKFEHETDSSKVGKNQSQPNGKAKMTQGINYGPEMLVKREFGRRMGKTDMKGASSSGVAKNEELKKSRNKGQLLQNDLKDMGKSKVDDLESNNVVESHPCGIDISNNNVGWTQVGSKRKAFGRRITRGKGNIKGFKAQARNKGSVIGELNVMSQNLFNALQNGPYGEVEAINEENILDVREQNDMGSHVNVVGQANNDFEHHNDVGLCVEAQNQHSDVAEMEVNVESLDSKACQGVELPISQIPS